MKLHRTLMKVFYLIASLLIFSKVLVGQKQNNVWYFGRNAGLDFNVSPPVSLKGKLNTLEGCASIADHAGGLLFYTDGRRVWDRMHNEMPNGTGLKGGNSSTQSAVIVPLPGSCTRYLIFTTEDHKGHGNLVYSLVDMKLNSGLGDIIPGSKNILLSNNSSEKITAVLHANGVDIWLIMHTFNSIDFQSYLITAAGVNPNPVISSEGSFLSNDPFENWYPGPIRPSHDGKKIVSIVAYHQICEVFDFNSTTGVLSNHIDLYSLLNGEEVYGAEFSPNDSLLYLTGFDPVDNVLKLFQINILDPEPQATMIAAMTQNFACCALQMGPDSKIYLSHLSASSMDVIHQPNNRGVDCQFEEAGVLLLPGTSAMHGLPQNIPYAFCPYVSLGANQSRCIGDSVMLGQSITSSEECPVHLSWFDGTTDAIKKITDSGEYWCDITTSCFSYRDTVKVVFDTIILSSMTVSICQGESYEGYSVPGIYVDTFKTAFECDSVRTLDLNFLPPVLTDYDELICKGSIFEGYTVSGIYSDTFLTVSGCDSIRVLRLTVVSCDPIIYYPLDACVSVMSNGSHMDYSEFIAEYPSSVNCADVDADIVHRIFPEKHSCTPGINGSPAMCVASLDTCEYAPGDPASVVFEFTIDPMPDSLVRIAYVSFFEKGPFQYEWINGASGQNNRPLMYGVRILKNGTLVYMSVDNPTSVNWSQRFIYLVENDHFLIDSFSHFRIELISYCRVGANSDISVWDLDEITIHGGCVSPLSDGSLIDGFVYNQRNQGMPNVDIELSTSPSFSETQIVRTAENGYFQFKSLEKGKSYYVRGYKNDDPLNGVSVSDLLYIQKHLLGLDPFLTLEPLVASDVNKSNSLNVLDYIILQKLLLGKYSSFPDNTSWRFAVLPQDFSVPDLRLFQEVKCIESLHDDVRGVNFMGIKIGDLNGDAR